MWAELLISFLIVVGGYFICAGIDAIFLTHYHDAPIDSQFYASGMIFGYCSCGRLVHRPMYCPDDDKLLRWYDDDQEWYIPKREMNNGSY